MRWIFVLVLFSGCKTWNFGPMVCTPYESRCNGFVSEMCGADGRWRAVTDCRAVEPGNWTCVIYEGDAICLPVQP